MGIEGCAQAVQAAVLEEAGTAGAGQGHLQLYQLAVGSGNHANGGASAWAETWLKAATKAKRIIAAPTPWVNGPLARTGWSPVQRGCPNRAKRSAQDDHDRQFFASFALLWCSWAR